MRAQDREVAHMIKIRFFNSIAEAELTRNLLKGHGIEAFVERKGLEFPGDLGDSYGAELRVAESDVEKAKEVLDDYGVEEA